MTLIEKGIQSISLGSTSIGKVYLGSTKVRPAGYTPGANTLLYLPLKSDTKEKSGNTIWSSNILTISGTITFNSSVANIPVAYFNGSSWIYTTPAYTTAYSTNTLSCWVRYSSYSNMPAILRRGSVNIYVQSSGITYEVWSSSSGHEFKTTTYLSTDTWQLLTLTSNGSTSYCYVNGTLVGTISYAPTQTDTGAGSYRPCIGNNVGDSGSRRLTGYISDIIWENKCWSTTELQTYYNNTKGDYGL